MRTRPLRHASRVFQGGRYETACGAWLLPHEGTFLKYGVFIRWMGPKCEKCLKALAQGDLFDAD